MMRSEGSTVVVRPATIQDVGGIALAHTRSIQAAYKSVLKPEDLALFTVDQTEPKMRAQFDGANTIFVAVVNGKIVGHARWGSVEIEAWPYANIVHALFLDPDFQGRRIGSKLLARCVETAEDYGHQGMMIGALTENAPAREWYKRLGGRMVVEEPLEIGSNAYDSVIFAFDDLVKLQSQLV